MSSDASETFDDAQCAALARLVSAVRRVNDLVASANGSVEELEALAERTELLGHELARHATGKPIPRYRYREHLEQNLNGLLPYSVVTGRYSPLAPPVEISREGDTIVGRVRFANVYEGPPDSVHGGIVSAVYDQLLAMATLIRGHGGMTASLTIQYRKKTPLDRELRWTAWTERIEGRKVFARGACHVGEELVSEAEGLFIRPPEARPPDAP